MIQRVCKGEDNSRVGILITRGEFMETTVIPPIIHALHQKKSPEISTTIEQNAYEAFTPISAQNKRRKS